MAKPHLHIVLCPFMSKGHTIPLLHLTKLIHKHRSYATFTIFTTPANKPFISASLSSSLPPEIFSIIILPFVATENIPPGVESTDKLPSMSLFYTFAFGLEQLQHRFETELDNLHNHHPVAFCVSDGFLYWTQQPTSKLNIPWLTFYGMNVYSGTISRLVFEYKCFEGVEYEEELVSVPDFPRVRVAKSDFDGPFKTNDPKGKEFDFLVRCAIASSMSYVCFINSFEELEKPFLEYYNSKYQPKSLCVGPLCLVDKAKVEKSEIPIWIKWLDNKLNEGKSVLYVAFGSQAEISNDQLKEILIGLEESEVNFLWALRIQTSQEEVMNELERRVKERGLIVREWVDQRAILEHESVQGFLTHCGWNSVIESICAGVPMLAWPMMAEQPLNARLIVEEVKVGLRVETCDCSVRGFVKRGLSKTVQDLFSGEIGTIVKKNVKDFSEVAKSAVCEGGSSWCNLESLLNDLEIVQTKRYQNRILYHENGSTNIPDVVEQN